MPHCARLGSQAGSGLRVSGPSRNWSGAVPVTPEIGRVSDFLLELYRDARVQPPGTFQLDTLDRLRSFVPFDFAAWGGGAAAGRQVTDVVMVDQSPGLFTEWSAVAAVDAYCDLALRRLNRTVLFDDVPHFRRSPAYNEHWRRFDAEHMVATIMAEPIDGYVSFVGLCSGDARQVYGEAERQRKQLLMPHISAALRLSRDSQVLTAGTPEEGVALVDRAGFVLASRAPFAWLVHEEWGETNGRVPGWILPAYPDAAGWRGHAIQMHIEPLQHHYLLRVRPSSPLDGLTRRELEVTERFARGMTYKQVARELEIAPSTVRNHLAGIYDKLGIRDKAELANLVRRTENPGSQVIR